MVPTTNRQHIIVVSLELCTLLVNFTEMVYQWNQLFMVTLNTCIWTESGAVVDDNLF